MLHYLGSQIVSIETGVFFSQDHLQVWGEIEADLGRVFTDGRTRVNQSLGMLALRRLLRAYALHNPAVGYCQGMNFIAGLLLQVSFAVVVQAPEI